MPTKQIRRYLPETLLTDLDTYLAANPLSKPLNRDATIELLWQIQKQVQKHDWATDDFATPLCAELLKSIRNDYRRYFDVFEAAGLVRIDHSYQVGVHSKFYQFAPHYYAQNGKDCYLSDPLVLKAAERAKQQRKPTDEGALHRLGLLSDVRIDLEAALDWIDQQDWKPARKHAVKWSCETFAVGDLYLTKDDQDREHTNLTSLPKHIRNNFLTINGEPITELDITASQPSFLLRWLKGKKIPKQELKTYQKAVRSDFYYVFARWWRKEYQDRDFTRDDAKPVVFRVFFDRTRPNDRYHQLFQKHFPTIYAEIAASHQSRGNRELACDLQRLEAQFVFGFCAEHLKTASYFTIHDSIYLPTSMAGSIAGLFYGCLFEVLGVNLLTTTHLYVADRTTRMAYNASNRQSNFQNHEKLQDDYDEG